MTRAKDISKIVTDANLSGTLDVTGDLTVVGSSTFDDIKLTAVALPAAGNPSIALRDTNNIVYHQSGSGNSIVLLDSSQNTMYNASSTSHIFNISNSEKMRIDSSGNVGIGTTSNFTDAKLHIKNVNGGGDTNLRIQNASTTTGTTTSLKFTNTTSDYAHISLISDRDRNLIFKNTDDTVETMRIDSSGSVGIGTTSPGQKLQVDGFIRSYDSSTTGIGFQLVNSLNSWNIQTTTGVEALLFVDNTLAEAMRIDSSGTMHFGRTSYNLSTSGHSIYSNGQSYHVASGPVTEFVRTGSDGSIVIFRKDGATVGSIDSTAGSGGATQGKLRIGTVDTKILFDDGTDEIYPSQNGVTTLGDPGARFNNLYLSGGVYLGGTGSANHLDDYEEGTWTPAYSTSGGSFTYDSATQGQYTKIGNVVTVYFRIYTTSATVGTGNITITGLPFAEAIPSGQGAGSIGDCRLFGGDTPSEIGVDGSSISLWYRDAVDGRNYRLTASALSTGSVANLIDGQITYITS